jgi:hypothetical protein
MADILAMSAIPPKADFTAAQVPTCSVFIFLQRRRRTSVSFAWSHRNNIAHSRRNAVALLNQPRRTSKGKHCWKWKWCGRSSRKKKPKDEQPKVELVDLFLRIWSRIFIRFIFLCQSQPCPRHLQEKGPLLFILSGLSNLQTLCGEATVVVRPRHCESRPPEF